MDFHDYPTTEKKIPWKAIGIVAGGIIIAAGIIWLVLAKLQPSASNSEKKQSGLFSGTATTDECSTSKNKDLCKLQSTKNKAVQSKDAKVCASLPDDVKDDCLWGVANVKKDARVCDELINKEYAAQCADGVIRDTAIEKKDLVMCDKIKGEDAKQACKETIQGPITSENCVARGKEIEFCDMLKTADSAGKAQDRAVCDSLKDVDSIQGCKARVLIDDPDFDGLSTSDEINIYHTDPRQVDTDGDGYKDSDEVKSGHDPLKK